MSLTKKQNDDFEAGTLVLYFPHIELTQRGSDKPKRYKGPGTVRQLDGNLKLEMFTKANASQELQESLTCGWQLGTLTPEVAYYDLNATDISGNSWHAERIDIDFHATLGSRDAVVSSNLASITKRSDCNSRPRGSMLLRLPIALKFPATAGSNEERRVADKAIYTKSSFNVARARIDGAEFEFRYDAEVLEVIAEIANDRFTDDLHWRVVEALSACFAKEMSPTLCRVRRAGIEKLSLFRKHEVRRTHLEPPINTRTHPQVATAFWAFFETYLTHTLTAPEGRLQPTSIWLAKVRDATIAPVSIYIEGLALSVAVEGLTQLFNLQALGPNQDKLADLVRHIEQWGSDNALRDRAVGAVRAMGHPRASDVLTRLAQDGVIEVSHVKSWKNLRNRVAHSRLQGESHEELQQQIDLCYVVLTLLYRLVGDLVGWAGPLTNYEVDNWPTHASGRRSDKSSEGNPK